MKMLKIYGGLAPEKVDALEKEFNLHLPADYRQFLLEVGGGIADTYHEEEKNTIPVEDLNDSISVAALYGIGNQPAHCSIDKAMRDYSDEIPSNSVIIGCEYFGSYLVLECGGENAGVWFWDDCCEYEATTEEFGVYFVADSFTEFINLLGGKLELPDGRVWKPAEA